MPDTNLLPCPWCGEAPQVKSPFARAAYSVKCRNEKCPVQPDMSFAFEHERHAISAWNERPALTPKQKAAEEMYEALTKAQRLLSIVATVFVNDKIQDHIPFGLADEVKAAFVKDELGIDAALAKAGQQ